MTPTLQIHPRAVLTLIVLAGMLALLLTAAVVTGQLGHLLPFHFGSLSHLELAASFTGM